MFPDSPLCIREERHDSSDITSKLASLKKLLPSLLLHAPPPPPVPPSMHRPTSACGKKICNKSKHQNILCFPGVTVLLLLYWLLTLKRITFNTFCPANNRFNSPAFGFLLQACSGFPTRLLHLHPWTAGLVVTAVLIMSTSPLALCCIKLESYSTQSWSCRNPARLRPPVRAVMREVMQCSSADSVRTLHLKQF